MFEKYSDKLIVNEKLVGCSRKEITFNEEMINFIANDKKDIINYCCKNKLLPNVIFLTDTPVEDFYLPLFT